VNSLQVDELFAVTSPRCYQDL